MTTQSMILVLARVGATPTLRHCCESTRARLDELQGALRSARLPGPLQPGAELELRDLLNEDEIHFLSFFLIEPDSHGNPAYVALELNSDRAGRALLRSLAAKAPSVFSALFQDCEGWSAGLDATGRARLLQCWRCSPNATYIAFPGHSVKQIRAEQALRARARRELPAHRDELGTALGLWRPLRARLAELKLSAAARPWLVRWSPRLGGFRHQLGMLMWRGFVSLLALSAMWGFLSLARRESWSYALWTALLSTLAGAALPAFLWFKESPKRLSLSGRLLLAKSAAGSIAYAGLLFSICIAGVPVLASLPHIGAVAVAALGVIELLLVSFVVYVAVGRAIALGALALLTCALLTLGVFFAESFPALLGLILILTIGLSLCVTVWTFVFLNAVRSLELAEAKTAAPSKLSWDLEHLAAVQRAEDLFPQNHLATLSQIKPKRLRVLGVVLRAVDLLSKVYFNRADLAGIRTIHYASFTILPDRKRLLFLGNYDGAFGAYLQEFNSVVGVTAVWSNTQGFPRSFFLVGDGASDEQRFKAFARRDQIETLGWHSAYPDLSIRDIENAIHTRSDLCLRFAGPFGLWESLREPGLSEADCDAALRRL